MLVGLIHNGLGLSRIPAGKFAPPLALGTTWWALPVQRQLPPRRNHQPCTLKTEACWEQHAQHLVHHNPSPPPRLPHTRVRRTMSTLGTP